MGAFRETFFSRGTRAQRLTLSVCVCGVWCVMCGVPWMDAMLRSVREELLYNCTVQ